MPERPYSRIERHPELALVSRRCAHWDLPRCCLVHACPPHYLRRTIERLGTALSGSFRIEASEDLGGGPTISAPALAAIERAALVICLLDDLPPNALFMLGYAAARGKPLLPVVTSGGLSAVARAFVEAGAGPGAAETDLRDLEPCPIDPDDPGALRTAVAARLGRPDARGRALGRRVLDAWIEVLDGAVGPCGTFDPLHEYIRNTRKLDLAKPLFGPRRRRRLHELLAEGFRAGTGTTGATALTPAAVEVIADLPADLAGPLIDMRPGGTGDDRRLRRLECDLALERLGEAEEVTLDDALTLHLRFLERWPDDGHAQASAAILLEREGRRDEAEARFRLALDVDGSDVRALHRYATLLATTDRRDESEALLRRGLEVAPWLAPAHADLAILLLRRESLDQAEGRFREAITLDPDDAVAQHGLGCLLAIRGRIDQAESLFRAAIALEPDRAAAHHDLAVALSTTGRHADAADLLARALEAAPDLAEAHAHLGRVHEELDRPEEAEVAYRRALDLPPDDPDTISALAILLRTMGRHAESETECLRALAVDPAHAEARLNHAVLLVQQGRFQEADRQYQIAHREEPARALPTLGPRGLLRLPDRRDAVDRDYLEALRARPDWSKAWSTLGSMYQYQLGRQMKPGA